MKGVLQYRTRSRSVRRRCHTNKSVQSRGENMYKKADRTTCTTESPKSDKQGTGERQRFSRAWSAGYGRAQETVGCLGKVWAIKGLESP